MDDIINATGKKNNKAITLNYDDLSYTPNDTCLYCLADNEVRLLLALLEYVGWKTRWYSPTGATIDQDVIDQLKAEVMYELMADHCDLDAAIVNINASLTTITTNITTINNNLTIVENNIEVINETVNEITIQNITNNLIVDITQITFTQVTTDTSRTAMYARYNGFCLSMVAFIMSAMYRVMEAQSAAPTDLATVETQAALLSVGIIVGLTAKTPGIALTNAQLLAAALDTTAVNNVACAMITKLNQLLPNAANFNAAFAAYTPPAYPAHEYIVWYCTNLYLQLLDGFAAWNSIADFYFQQALAANPTDFNCTACAVSGYCSIPQTWDFTIPQLIPWVINRGTLTVGQGIVGAQIAGDLQFGIDISIYFPTPCTSILTHNVEIGHAHLASIGNAWTVEWYYLLAGVETRYNTSNRAQTAVWPAADADTFAIPAPPGGAGIYRIRFYTNTPYYGNAGSQPSSASKLTYFKFKT